MASARAVRAASSRRMKKTKLTIRTGEGYDDIPDATGWYDEVCPHLAVVKPFQGGKGNLWTIYHRCTGSRVLGAWATREEALEIVKKLAPIWDWAQTEEATFIGVAERIEEVLANHEHSADSAPTGADAVTRAADPRPHAVVARTQREQVVT